MPLKHWIYTYTEGENQGKGKDLKKLKSLIMILVPNFASCFKMVSNVLKAPNILIIG